MADYRKSDFENAFAEIAKCVATLNCGCSMNEDDKMWAEFLYREAHTYISLMEVKKEFKVL